MWDNPFLVMELALPAIDWAVAEIGEFTNSDDPFYRETACAILAGAENETFYTLMAGPLQEIGVPELTIQVVVGATRDAYTDLHRKRCVTANSASGLPIPDFQLAAAQGGLVSLSGALEENKIVVIVFYRGFF